MKNNKLLFLILLTTFFVACSNNSDQGVLSLETQELKQETAQIEEISPEDAQLIIADCLRDNGYDVQDPTPNKSLRDQIRPENEKERQEVFEIISLCAEENNLPIFSENRLNMI